MKEISRAESGLGPRGRGVGDCERARNHPTYFLKFENQLVCGGCNRPWKECLGSCMEDDGAPVPLAETTDQDEEELFEVILDELEDAVKPGMGSVTMFKIGTALTREGLNTTTNIRRVEQELADRGIRVVRDY